MLIRRAALTDGRVADIRVGERIADIAERLEPLDSEDVVDADRGAVLPGLHDHHLHLRAMAAALDSLSVGPPQVRTEGQLAQALKRQKPDPTAGSALSATTRQSRANSTGTNSTR